MRQTFFSIILGTILLLCFITNWYGALSISLLVVLTGMILYKIGNGIVLLEITAVFYVFTCLIMALAGYKYYSYNNYLSRLWIKYMPISEDIYFQYTLPAVAAFCFAITLPSFTGKLPDTGAQIQQRITQIRQLLTDGRNKGLQIMIAGTLISMVAKSLPASLNYFAVLFFFGSFAGLLYIFFSPGFKYKKVIIFLFIIFIIRNALQTGMFTLAVYMGITIFSFFQLGKKSSMLKKVFFMFLGISFFIVLQNVKGVYRKNTWKSSYEGSKVELFSNLFANTLQKGTGLLGANALFPVYTRTNQGYNIALVMRRIPRIQSYDNGDRLLTVFASAFIPRFLWSDKPEAGGKFNMKYYAGFTLIGWSTNVGPLGEAYGSFGVTGGIIYMLLLGLFLRWAYFLVFKLSGKIPLLLCWLPILFYEVTSSAETDTLQILNSMIKSAFFIWLLIKFLPQWFGINSTKTIKPKAVKNVLPA